ncbi:MAG: hypothetical protein ACRD15_18915 [Vicinamibacterales bacterium]
MLADRRRPPASSRAAGAGAFRAPRFRIDALLAILGPDVVLRADRGAPSGLLEIRGAREIARGAPASAELAARAEHVLVNGSYGILAFDADGGPYSVLTFALRSDRIAGILIVANPWLSRRAESAEQTM